jgi:hypothetical protein
VYRVLVSIGRNELFKTSNSFLVYFTHKVIFKNVTRNVRSQATQNEITINEQEGK